ncbi:hypothetical protein OBBRIDRAFT_806423 [Obba rivulosa]|uniref:Uncharacterized protein n=1 Tax=Obba rivulosa TaxID=1052685 RepID=A0A8E2ALM7_9APHY|nr:hypothetical protein OBBRIDRAFT_806423 [Obba rivulosa]
MFCEVLEDIRPTTLTTLTLNEIYLTFCERRDLQHLMKSISYVSDFKLNFRLAPGRYSIVSDIIASLLTIPETSNLEHLTLSLEMDVDLDSYDVSLMEEADEELGGIDVPLLFKQLARRVQTLHDISLDIPINSRSSWRISEGDGRSAGGPLVERYSYQDLSEHEW